MRRGRLPAQHGRQSNAPNSAQYPLFNGDLRYDLARGGILPFNGHTDVKQVAMYVQDNITLPMELNLGIRGDIYNGLTI